MAPIRWAFGVHKAVGVLVVFALMTYLPAATRERTLTPCVFELSWLGCADDLTAKETAYLERLSTDDGELNEVAVAMVADDAETRAQLLADLGDRHCPGLEEPVVDTFQRLLTAKHQLDWLHDAVESTLLSPTVPVGGPAETAVASEVVSALISESAKAKEQSSPGLLQQMAYRSAAPLIMEAIWECT